MIQIKPYQGRVDVTVNRPEGNAIQVQIETDNLRISTPVDNDLDEWCRIFGSPDVMKQYLSGATVPRDAVQKRLDRAVKRALGGDPFHMMSVRNKSGQLLGMIVAGHGDRPGESELAGLGGVEFQNQGYGKEATTALLHGLFPLFKDQPFLDGAPLRKVVATALPDNLGSNRVMQNAGMNFEGLVSRSGALRNIYSISADDLGLDRIRRKTEVIGPNSVTKMGLLAARIKLIVQQATLLLGKSWEKIQSLYERVRVFASNLLAHKPNPRTA
jgi:RimJ/RimL family protein N-acetyltransferase